MGTQLYMAPEYIHGELSTKVDAFAFGLVVLETLTGYAVCSPAPGHRNLLAMSERCLETRRTRRPELVELIPELEEVRRSAEVTVGAGGRAVRGAFGGG